MGGRKNNNLMFLTIILSLGLIVCLVSVGLYLSSWEVASRGWLMVPLIAVIMVFVHIWHSRWLYWLSSGGSFICLAVGFAATESHLSLTALSFLYLFVRV